MARALPVYAKPTPARGRNMSAIRSSKNKSTEMRLLKLFQNHKIKGWRRNRKILGKPDFVFPGPKLAVFVDGCFWHGCPRCFKQPKVNPEYWIAKIARNKRRDGFVTDALANKGWSVLRLWEHQLRARPKWVVSKVKRSLL